MDKLFGPERFVLQAIHDLPKDKAGYVSDADIAQRTQIDIADISNCLEILGNEEYIDVIKRKKDRIALITAKGRLALREVLLLVQPGGHLVDSLRGSGVEERRKIAVIGLTGVGKSSLINGLIGSDVLNINRIHPEICTFPELSASCDSAHEALNEPADFWAQAPY